MSTKKSKKTDWPLLIAVGLFIFGFIIRVYNIYPSNIILGFDQIRDLSEAKGIWENRDLRIMGQPAGNSLYLRHGVLFLYYLLLPLVIFGENPLYTALWNAFFNSLSIIVIFFLTKSLFRNNKAALTASFIAAVSYYLVQYSGWLSNPTVTLLTVPVFYLGLWEYYKGKKWGLPLAFFFLGISIQFEIFYIYLVPVIILYWIFLKPSVPSIKLLFVSLLTGTLALSTMLLTEIKFRFGGLKDLLHFGGQPKNPQEKISELNLTIKRVGETFSSNLWPSYQNIGEILFVVTLILLIYFAIKDKNQKSGLIFIIIYLLSPFLMLAFGYHAAPWFLIGLPGAIVISGGYLISKLNNKLLILPLLIVIGISNFTKINEKRQILLEPDPSSLMKTQLEVVDYTYLQSQGNPFSINSLTNPLYINSPWAYHYKWYGEKKYGYLPGWSGGDQLYPYNTLPVSTSGDKYIFLLIDKTPRIPHVHKLLLLSWADKNSKLIEEKNFEGILVQKRGIK